MDFIIEWKVLVPQYAIAFLVYNNLVYNPYFPIKVMALENIFISNII